MSPLSTVSVPNSAGGVKRIGLDEIRAVVVIEHSDSWPRRYSWLKVSVTGDVETITNYTAAVDWLNQHIDFHMAGAFATDEQGQHLAVCWLLRDDSPELLSEVLEMQIVPATCAWSPTEGKIVTTRTAEQIKRQRRRVGQGDSRDLQFIPLPTRAQTMCAYGLSQ